ncbi:uncharacterized protein LOC128679126 [Plodia interpunctella]|uniref:uncharacterized protein LOC128679126 n=1 Tax=Plodia interpunctella TaxID=58824 RepID=UPI002367E05A|nr:uncharacterized protein LOC128679126 [Plodia interpunctella]
MYLIRLFLLVAIISESHYALPDLTEPYVLQVSDFVANPPKRLIKVTFPSGAKVAEGNELSVDEVEGYPNLSWGAEEGVLYTVLMCDADARYLHWLKINVVMDDISTGDTVVELLNSHPRPGTGLHKYVFLVYRQQDELLFGGPYPNSTFKGRLNFLPDEFAARYRLGDPVACNFYVTQNVPTTTKKPSQANLEEIQLIMTKMQEDMKVQKDDIYDIKKDIRINVLKKLKCLEAKCAYLEQEQDVQKKTIDNLEGYMRQKEEMNDKNNKNLLFCGIEEDECDYNGLEDKVLKILNSDLKITCDNSAIEYVKRIDKKCGKYKAVLVTLLTMGLKLHILEKQKMLEKTEFSVKQESDVK